MEQNNKEENKYPKDKYEWTTQSKLLTKEVVAKFVKLYTEYFKCLENMFNVTIYIHSYCIYKYFLHHY